MLCFVFLKVVVRKSLTEAGRDLAELVEQLLDIVKGLQSESHLPEPGPDNEVSMGGGGWEEGSARRGKDVPGVGLRTASTAATQTCLLLKDAMNLNLLPFSLLLHMDDRKFGMLEVRQGSFKRARFHPYPST